MAISGEHLLEVNGGELLPGLFPGKTVGQITAILDAYVQAGYTLAAGLADDEDQDTAARNYGYWKATERRIKELAGTGRGSIALPGQFSVATTGEQLAQLERQAEAYRKAFRQMVPEQAASSTLPRASTSTPIITTW